MTEPTWESVARMLSAADTPDAPRRDTSAGWKQSAENRKRSAVERRALEEFAPNVPLLSDKTLRQLTGLLLAQCDLRRLDVSDLIPEG